MAEQDHPLLTLFGLGTEGGFSGSALLSHPLQSSRRCLTCKRSVTVPNFEYNVLTIRKIGPDEWYEGSEAVPPTNQWPPTLQHNVYRRDIVQVLLDEGITGIVPREVSIEIEDYEELPEPIPEYLLLEPTGRFDVRVLHDDVRICPECKSRTDRVFRGLVYLPLLDTWDGSDLCEIKSPTTRGIFCSKRFIEMARRRRLEFFRFGHRIPHVTVDYLGAANWYEDVHDRTKAKYPHLFQA